MFSVLFEVQPNPDKWDAYLNYAKILRPELEAIDGFVDNVRYSSLTRKGWILSLSNWRDEKSLVRWRTKARHHEVQERGREEVLSDYRLRVGQTTNDTQVPDGYALKEQRLDETEVGEAKTVSLINIKRPGSSDETDFSDDWASALGLPPFTNSLFWDVFEAVLTPGELIVMVNWRDSAAAEALEKVLTMPLDARVRRIRIVRDYAMYDRREAPQYFPDAPSRPTTHS